MELSHLRALIAVIDHGSFAAAASHLRVSRSTLRARLAVLEGQVGVTLLTTSHAGTVATPAGVRMLGKARKLLADAASLSLHAHGEASAPVTFQVRVPTGSPARLHLNALRATMAEGLLPVRVSFCDDPRTDPDPSADLYIHWGPPLARGAYQTQVVRRVPQGLFATQGYLDKHGVPHTLAALKDHVLFSWAHLGRSSEQWPLIEGGIHSVQPHFQSNSQTWVEEATYAGLGLGLLPTSEATPKLVQVLPEVVGGEVPLRVSVRAAPEDPERSQLHRDIIRRLLVRT